MNTKDGYGRTPLFLAAERGHDAIVRVLLERGEVKVNTKDRDGQTTLYMAAVKGHDAVVRLLLVGCHCARQQSAVTMPWCSSC
jgi:ankyrin repeat protein